MGPIACLLIALADMPYGYYQILRVLIFAISLYLAINEGIYTDNFWFWAFVVVSLIYNPIARLPLGREIWSFMNGVTIVIFGVHFCRMLKANSR
ncbi:MAG: DUF6804 family protein [Sphingomonas sp.]